MAPRFSVLALLAALQHRDRSGEGQQIDQSQAECSMHTMALALAESSLGAAPPDRLGNGDPAICPHDVYACAGDDQWLAIAKRAEIDHAIAEWTRTREATDVEAQLQRAGVPAHAVMNAELSMRDAQLAHRGHFLATEHALLGTVFVESSGYRFETAVPAVGRVPSLGADSERVRALLAGR